MLETEMNKAPFPIVIIEWSDSRQPTSSWEWLEELTHDESVLCSTAGHLIKESETDYIIALSIGDVKSERPQANGVMTLPKSCVKKITSLNACVAPHAATSTTSTAQTATTGRAEKVFHKSNIPG